MSATLQSLGIDRLTVAERIHLIQEIWDSIALERDQPPLSEVQRAELDRRLEAHLRNPDAAVTWEQVEADALSRLTK